MEPMGFEFTSDMETKEFCGATRPSKNASATRRSRVSVNDQDDIVSQAIQKQEEQSLMIANEITGLSSS